VVKFHPFLTTNKSKISPSLIIMNLSNLRSSKSSILDKTLTKGKNEVSLSLFALVFSEIVQYSQKNSQSVADLAEKVK
jgi:trafficking protein particle complex subunit 5